MSACFQPCRHGFAAATRFLGNAVLTPEQRLAQRLRDRRVALGLSQADVADRLRKNGWFGVRYQTVQSVEAGERQLKGVEDRRFATALELDPDSIKHGLGVLREVVKIEGTTAVAHAEARSPGDS